MAKRLELGGCAPSWQRLTTNGELNSRIRDRTLNQTTLREGYVVAKHYPDDPGYTAFRNVVYDVLVATLEDERALTWDLIRNVPAQGPIGNGVDYSNESIRAPDKWEGIVPDNKLLEGSSRVLISFVDGRTNTGVIVGCLPHKLAPSEKRADGHSSVYVFNGARTEINKYGELSFVRTGIIIKDDNTVTKPEDVKDTSGAFVKFDKDGNIQIDNTHGESVVVDNKNKVITVTARAKTENITEKDWTVNVKGNVNITASGNASFNASGKTFLGSTKAKENVVLGLQLQKALNQLVSIIQTFQSTPSIPGQPVLTSPFTQQQLVNWNNLYGKKTSPFLSKKKFTE
jgi:hypothetical protein